MDDIDKVRDDLQSTKQMLASELRNKEAHERESKRLLARIQNLEAELEKEKSKNKDGSGGSGGGNGGGNAADEKVNLIKMNRNIVYTIIVSRYSKLLEKNSKKEEKQVVT